MVEVYGQVRALAFIDHEMASCLGCRLSSVDFDNHYVRYGSATAGQLPTAMGRSQT